MKSAIADRAFAAHWLGRVGLSNALVLALAIATIGAGIATYFFITQQLPMAANPDNVSLLLMADLGLLGMLCVLVGWRIIIMLRAKAQGRVGARLHFKLVLTFSLLAVMPAVIVTGLSAVFLFAGVQTWFSSSVSSAVRESRAVAESAIDAHQRTIIADTLTIASALNRELLSIGSNEEKLEEILNREMLQRAMSDAIIFNSSGKILARSNLGFSLGFATVRDVDLSRASSGDIVLMQDADDGRARALMRLDRYVDAYLLVSRLTDPTILGHLQKAEEASAQYAAFDAKRVQIQYGVMLMFGIISIVLLLMAVVLGLNVANQLVRPVSALIQASDRVRNGDLTVRVSQTDRDNELGTLIRSFNRMTNQLQTQRRELIETNRMLDERRRFIEAVLAGVSAGILNTNPEGVIRMANTHASDLIGLTEDEVTGRSVLELLPEMESLFEEARRRIGRNVEKQIIIKRAGKTTRTLHARLAPEIVAEDLISGYVLTFDEITELVSAQRMAAWADVARRIAHEIKNPLTPIQLSAERLKRKYLPQITQDQQIFSDCTDTIFRQVDDIRRMVDEFSSFARMPAAVIKPYNISSLIREAVVLQREAHQDITFSTLLPEQDLSLPCDHRQVRQALTNLIQNAVDSITERTESNPAPGKIEVALQQDSESVSISIRDNGKGLPSDDRDRLTEPYVTTRVKGTGLGLAIVKKILEDHSGSLALEDNPTGGANVRLVFPVTDAKTIQEETVLVMT